ncbi:hypothetical protein QBC32DRAFT_365433 [Pseudoneurospora amorphoporcata]|uniref:Uncharacterized protein n=1 Tax=Pseudoneurospora amorphoporcata TaxID=241081 RepID=A0AAN6NL88_9PEZI|nr:hypothetical protein QBC32DRAFT_365433 [Pseudoneurospora amorphoporcata]
MTSTPWRPNMTLKECLPCKGMLWENRQHILHSLERDELILRSFRENYIPIAPGNIAFEVTMLVFVANQQVTRHHKPIDYVPGKKYDFFAKIARFNRTGRKLPQNVYVLFRELIGARVRFLERNPNSAETPSELAVKVDEVINNMGGCYSDAEMCRRLEEEILKAESEQSSSIGDEH